MIFDESVVYMETKVELKILSKRRYIKWKLRLIKLKLNIKHCGEAPEFID